MSVADNLGSHKGDAVRNAIRDVGACLVFLPKYSRLNPIEPVSAKFKTLLRKARARTTRDLRRLRQNSARRMRLIPQEGRNA
jgi:transposase